MEKVNLRTIEGYRFTYSPPHNTLDYAIFVSYLLQSRRFFHGGNVSYQNCLISLAEGTTYKKYLRDLINLINFNELSKLLEKIDQLCPHFFQEILDLRLKFSVKAFCQKVSKALNVLILIYDHTSKEEFYSGRSSEAPIMISLIKISGKFFTFFHREEIIFENSVEKPLSMLESFPFVKHGENTSDSELFSVFSKAILSVSQFIKKEKKDDLNALVYKGNIDSETQNSIRNLAEAAKNVKSCDLHRKDYFQCRTVHCLTCFLTPDHRSNKISNRCPCGTEVSTKFIEEKKQEINKSLSPPPPPPPLSQEIFPNPLTPKSHVHIKIPGMFNNKIPEPAKDLEFQKKCIYCGKTVTRNEADYCMNSHSFCKNCSPYIGQYCPACNNLICESCKFYIIYQDCREFNQHYYHTRCLGNFNA